MGMIPYRHENYGPGTWAKKLYVYGYPWDRDVTHSPAHRSGPAPQSCYAPRLPITDAKYRIASGHGRQDEHCDLRPRQLPEASRQAIIDAILREELPFVDHFGLVDQAALHRMMEENS